MTVLHYANGSGIGIPKPDFVSRAPLRFLVFSISAFYQCGSKALLFKNYFL
jgi:hypothetical protein